MVAKHYSCDQSILFHRPLRQIRSWIDANQSGALLGLPGSGKSRLLYMLAQRPQTIGSKQPVVPVLLAPLWLRRVDEKMVYRALLQAIYEARATYAEPLRRASSEAYHRALEVHDPFVLHSMLRQLIEQFRLQEVRMVWLFDNFDSLFKAGSSAIDLALRHLRDSFADTISFLVAMRREPARLATTSRSNAMLRLFEVRQHWLGPLEPAEVAGYCKLVLPDLALDASAQQQLALVTGGWPSLLEAAAQLFASGVIGPKEALLRLQQQPPIERRLHAIWEDLTFDERCLLFECVSKKRQSKRWRQQHAQRILQLQQMRLLDSRQRLFSPLFEHFVRNQRHTVRGRVWFNERDDTFYQGPQPLDRLSPRAEAALLYFLKHPYKKCEKDQLIDHVWNTPHVTDDSLYQVIRELRKVLEPDSRNPCYIINHRSLRGGRYQFFPEGKPAA